MTRFRDRHEAGSQLALLLQHYEERRDAIVLALPRGGAPIGYEVATRLGLPLDVLVVRKLGAPGHSELAMGAIASGGIHVIDRTVISELQISKAAFQAVLAEERVELERRERLFRGEQPTLDVRDRTVIVVDDGLATGSSMRAAIESLRQRRPAAIVVAIPVAPAYTIEMFRPLVNEIICPLQPENFVAVGLWYVDFAQTTDDEVRDLLDAAARALVARRRSTPGASPAVPA